MFIIGQIVGVFVTIAAILSLQFKEMKHILATQVLANTLLMLNYWLLDAFSGAAIAIIATVQTVIMFVIRLFENKMPKKINLLLTVVVTVIFAGIFIYSSVITYKSPVDILSALASLAFCICIAQKNAFICRIFVIVNSLLWIGYDIGTFAWTTIITHAFSLSSSLIGMMRFDIKRR